jgi:hypothetical protein
MTAKFTYSVTPTDSKGSPVSDTNNETTVKEPSKSGDVDKTKPIGVLLDLGAGAPLSPHTVVGVRGQYRPDNAVPIGGEGEASVDEIEAAIASGAPLKLVNIPKTQVDQLRALAAEDIAAARRGAVIARQDGLVGAEAALLSEHIDAVKDNS